ncbi:MAG: SCO family protein [Alphaproteobacteria bacterium]
MNTLSKSLAVLGLSAFVTASNAQEHEGHEAMSAKGHDHHQMMPSDGGQNIMKKSPIEDSSLAGLIDYNGRKVDDKDFEGKKRLIFFGFTNCPHVCPTGMATLSSALRQLDEKYGDYAAEMFKHTDIVMVSTDPDNDTPARMKEWLGYFDDRIIGLTGDEDLLQEKAENYRADRMGHHSPYLYILDEKGEYAGLVNTQDGADKVMRAIEEKVLGMCVTSPETKADHSAHHDM